MFGPFCACWRIAQLALSQLGFGHLWFKWPCWNWTGGLGIGMSATNGKSSLEQHGLGLFPPPHPAFCQLEGSFGLGGCLSRAPRVPSSVSPVSLPWCGLVSGDAVRRGVMQGPPSHPPVPVKTRAAVRGGAALAGAACPADVFSRNAKSMYRKP